MDIEPPDKGLEMISGMLLYIIIALMVVVGILGA